MIGLEEYTPSPECPWDRVRASHLLRRAGFVPGEEEVQAALRDGPGVIVDRLVESGEESARHRELDALGERLGAQDNIGSLRGWWLLRMCRTARPLHARMAVFWHNHFATSNAKVRSAPMMLGQLRAIERGALGKFGELALAMARDPAMIVWLDGEENVKGRPNENFARELLELFTLGVGNYTERDIKGAARAFTGWHRRGGEFHFARGEHDEGEKAVLGTSGNLDGADVVAIACRQEACGRFLAGKLLREFVCPEPPEELIGAVAGRLRETDLDVGAAVRTLLKSRAFYDARWMGARIKSPVEFAVGIVRSLEMQVPGPALADAVSQMGQRLFEPPSVKGWDGHRAWLNTATMLVRLNAATAAARAGERGANVAALRARYSISDSDVVPFCERLALGAEAPPPLREQLAKIEGPPDEQMRAALEVLLTSPEYQMA
jgi:uncharacterized protein (DUF1800 family)